MKIIVIDFDSTAEPSLGNPETDNQVLISTALGSRSWALVKDLLGLPTYANLSDANDALPPGKPFYNQALNKLDTTTA